MSLSEKKLLGANRVPHRLVDILKDFPEVCGGEAADLDKLDHYFLGDLEDSLIRDGLRLGALAGIYLFLLHSHRLVSQKSLCCRKKAIS